MSSYYRARTSRSQPSNPKSIFGTSVGLRPLIRPGPGWGRDRVRLQPAGIRAGAGLSGDPAMTGLTMSATATSGFAVEARAAHGIAAAERYSGAPRRRPAVDPEDNTYPSVRERYKPVVLSDSVRARWYTAWREP